MNHSSFQVSYLYVFSFVFLVALKNVADDVFLMGNRTRHAILIISFTKINAVTKELPLRETMMGVVGLGNSACSVLLHNMSV